ncbi:preprotein translocase subunit SecA [Patescibacteria group bacterium]
MPTFKAVEKLFGDQNKRKLKVLQKDVDQVNALEESVQKLSDEELRAKTDDFRKRLKDGATLEDIKYEAFAVVREAAMRTLGQRHYDVQIIGGIVLHSGAIAEMRTGEGKTLAATTATYLNALEGKGVHIVTVNDYLARRDADWMGQVYHFLGMTIACIQNQGISFIYDADLEKVKRPDSDNEGDGESAEDSDTASTEGDGYESLVVADMDHLREVDRREAYQADILFGTNNEFGFDYLRDNMVHNAEERVQRPLHYAIIDEVDSILIDEARTPLIISAPAEEATEQYYQFTNLVAGLTEDEDYNVDEKMRSVALTDEGIKKLEKSLGVDNIYVAGELRTVHHIEQALKARCLFTKDKDYVVKDDEVIIIDEFTGRMMHGRRYSEGLHQAIEAKEGLKIKQESRTLATITLQNLFRMYDKLAGMTGTAETESEEFFKIYTLDVVVMPTHREIIREDSSDRVYKSMEGKYKAVVARIKELHEKGQPVLVGTVSIEHNEIMAQLLTANGIPHKVLNAKQHEKEAEVIAQAGKLGAVTVATNMAGRGVDIILGGNPVDVDEARKVKELGGLAVLGTERHEARRIDNQLRGRTGRQGDPGMSQFYVSMDDELMRIFGSDRMKNFMSRLGVSEDMPIENKMVSRSIESAQNKVESRNFDIRKHLLEYDDVINKHRDTIYRRRNSILDGTPAELRLQIIEMIDAEIEHVVSFHTNQEDTAQWNMKEVCEVMKTIFPMTEQACLTAVSDLQNKGDGKLQHAEARTKMIEFFTEKAHDAYEKMVEDIGDEEVTHQVERGFSLRAIDLLWIEHLDQMSFLRDSIGLRGYGQRDPLVEYKRESYQMFQELLGNMQKQVVYNIYKLRDAKIVADKRMQGQNVNYSAPAKQMERAHPLAAQPGQPQAGGGQPAGEPGGEKEETAAPYVSEKRDDAGKKIGRNEPCPCGSGKKYKKCHGA